MPVSGRRNFLLQVGGLAGAAAITDPISARPGPSDTRTENALMLREIAAGVEGERPAAGTATNNDESLYPNKIASFSKGLPHSQLGEVNPLTSYQSLPDRFIHPETFRCGKHPDRQRAKACKP